MPSTASESGWLIKPRIILHGGAGNITRKNLPSESYHAYRSALLSVLHSASNLLSLPDCTALDVATHAVTLLEDNPLFNAGKGAVFTRDGTNELESSIMVSNGYRRHGVGCMMLRRVRNPIKLAREMLVREEEENGGGAQGHCQLSGEPLEHLAEAWGLELVSPDYFWTKKRWEEQMRGLAEEEQEQSCSQTPSIDECEYLPQGTVGCVVLDSSGMLCVATSTGGLTNKLSGRIGDTPTLGAGFWAEEWTEECRSTPQMLYQPPTTASQLESISRGDLSAILAECLPTLASYVPTARQIQMYTYDNHHTPTQGKRIRHAVAMSGTGNGDTFLRTNAVRTAAAISRFSPCTSLASAVTQIAGPDGEMQRSASDRWGKTGEGEGGIIGIELVGQKAEVVWDFNCGGMFRAWIDDRGSERFMVFKGEYTK
ncbi:hypothetical protein LTR16_003694 [Cryomyces antarcticus]|uniref:N-terminal nucleophile aminohydrolase n=1 Tax=Cryomyces antarcticus TaxID=329879 RepID=A0ABR0KSC2_9PEZI|nr:hypothetical protein LTR16_003694 [Cryomyces antarcticus]